MLWSFPFLKKFILRFFFPYKSHGLFPLHISISILAFCGGVEFSSLCFLSRKSKRKIHFSCFFFFFSLFFSLKFFVFYFGCIQLLFLLFFTICSYSWIYINLFQTCLFIFAFLFFSLFIFSILFSTPSFSLFFPFFSFYLSLFNSPFFPSLFLLSPIKLNCPALYAIFPSWPSAHAQISRLSIN